ncbi:O-antigen ligase [Bacillus cereus group sp. BfR-BA-01423]|uniref:O-antigen ligase family protein n=1 Tax=Bacillus cereus group sp. BfR-BA-01423 TaxID=2920340 RepID=UPI001F55F211|nr:O-antigen ligase family protein [Bacillus cereus group sp. BfR-BA-01423]
MIKMLSKKNIIKDKSDDKKISMALISSFVILTIQYFILIYFNLLGTSAGAGVQLLSKILVGVAFAYALPIVLRRNKIKFMATYFIGIFIFSIHYLFFAENQVYLKGLIFPFFFMCLPAFVYSISLSDWDVLKQNMKKASVLIFTLGVILGTLIFSGKLSVGAYSMSLSYYMLLPAVIFLEEFIETFSLKAFLFSITSVIVILALGSRGAILCIIVFVVLKSIRFNLTNSKILFNLIAIGIIIPSFIYLEYILKFIYNLLLNFGIESRSILLFLREDVHLSGRDYIYQNTIRGIAESPILGLGLGGDRQINGGGYVHNFFLEVLANFGLIVGGMLLVVIMLLILKSLLVNDKKKYSMVIIWLSLGFVQLMISSSYLIDINFWILLGLLVKVTMINTKSNGLETAA